MKSRRVALVLVIIVSLMSLAGCWDSREINDTAFVLSMGIARAENGEFRVSVEITKPKRAGGASETGGGGQANTFILASTGKTVHAALSRISVTLGRTIDEGHCNVLIVHEQVLKDGGFTEILDRLTRYYMIRREKIILASNVDPQTILMASPQLEPAQGINLFKALTTAKMDCLPGYQSTIRDVMLRQSTYGVHPILGLVGLLNEPDGRQTAQFTGIDVLDGDTLMGTLPKDESRFVNMILNEARGSTLVLEVPAPLLADSVAKPTPGYHGGDLEGSETAQPRVNPIAVQVTSSHTNISAHLEGGVPVVDVKVKLRAQILEMGVPADLSSPVVNNQLNTILSQYVAERIKAAIALTQAFPKGADIFFLGEAIHDRFPSVWTRVNPNWDQYYKTLKVNVSVQGIIFGTGRALDPSIPHK